MLRKICGIATVLAVSGCATPYVGTPYDRAGANVQRIAVADDSVPEKAVAWEVASVGSNFGLIGALIDAGVQSSRQDAVNDALNSIQFDAEAKLESRVVSALTTLGYEATVLEGAARAKRVYLESYQGAAEGAAYLDVVVTGYGYVSAGAGQPFRPTLAATVRLARADGTKLMENQVVYNGMYVREGVITLTPNPEYAFNNREELLADPNRLAAGIEDALNQVADTVARLLQ